MQRRQILKGIGTSATAGGLVTLAGCSGGDGGDGGDGGGGDGGGGDGGDGGGGDGGDGGGGDGGSSSVTFKWGGVGVPKGNCLDCVDPYGSWEFAEQVNGEIDSLTIDVVAQAQLCGDGPCVDKMGQGVVQLAHTSMGNSTRYMPENNIFAPAYLFPPRQPQTQTYAVFHPETWERYWVPFGKKYGIVPVLGYLNQFRVLHIGTNASEKFDGRMRLPKDIEGLKMRRTYSRISGNVMSKWGASPVEVGWGDTVQGLKSGLVDGLETWQTNVCAFGMAPSIGQTIKNNWTMGYEPVWGSVDALKSLPKSDMEKFGQMTKEFSEQLSHLTEEAVGQRAGSRDPPPEGSCYAENGITVNELEDDELETWKEPVSFAKNKSMYSKTYEQTGKLIGDGASDGKEFAEFLYDLVREDSAPSSPSDIEHEAWWIDYIDQM